MTELLAGYIGTVEFVVPEDLTTATFTVSKDGAQIGASATALPTGGVASVTLPYAATVEPGSVDVTLRFNYQSTLYEPVKTVEVVSPYVQIHEIKALLDITDTEEAVAIELAARHVINSYTGQRFDKSHKTLTVEGHGETALRLPERLVELDGVSTLTGKLDPNSIIVVSDGWYIKKRWADVIEELETDDEYFGEDTRPGGVTYAPTGHHRVSEWRDDYPFKITGTWGYNSVPVPVVEAARLLAEDYSCLESSYRDKFLKNIRAADWRLEFSSRSWESTGNARADMLLSDYIILDWAVV